MANARAFVGRVLEANNELVAAMTKVREVMAQFEANPQILEVLTDWQPSYPGLTVDDLAGAYNAWIALFGTYDAGTPTNKSKIYRIL